MPEDARQAWPRVAAILVVHDGEDRLPAVLSTLGGQDYPALDLVVVDNASTDATAEILRRRVPEERRLTLPQNTGFPRAVHAAMRHELVRDAEYVLLVHDDLLLAPDAVTRMVRAMQTDASLAVTGPKLREWSEDPVLQQVGMTVDRFGRAESGIEPWELDQGQADQRSDVLYVSTAGMLLRADVFADLRGFDPRMPAMRDDLDYCWRVWLTGWRVGVVPEAVGYHVAAGSRGARPLWRDRPAQARYLGERHALVAVLKCYGPLRLAWILPAILLLGVTKVGAFTLTRRFGAAGATVRAYLWNAAVLSGTLRMRRQVQRRRRRRDAELRPLFATGLPRVREYGDAVREWIAGEDTPAILHDGVVDVDPTRTDAATPLRLLREHPVAAVGTLLAAAYAIGLVPLLGGGQLIGGDVLPWPEEPGALLQTYVSAAAGEPLASAVAPSPIQAVLGAVGLLGFGSAWAAQRIVVLGLLPLAWITALRAGRLVSSHAAPRVLGATLYVLSPPVVAALAWGRLGELIVAALLPAIVLLTARAAGPRTKRSAAWRSTALLGVIAAVAVAAAPGAGIAVALVLVVGLVVAVWPGLVRVGRPALRMVTAVAVSGLLLTPWLVTLASADGATWPDAPAVDVPAWRALSLAPDVLPGLSSTLSALAGTVTGAVVVLALVLGFRLRPLPVTALVAALVASAGLAWGAGVAGLSWVWAPGLLAGGALAVSGLAVVAARILGPALRERAFGLVQIVAVLSATVLLAGLGVGTWRVATGPWDGLERAAELVPPFVAADEERVGPYRVLLVDVDANGALRWTITGAEGPEMRTFGAVPSPVLTGHVDQTLARILGGDPDAGADLGRMNVRYTVLSDAAMEELGPALVRQPDLEPLAAGGGGVLRLSSWVPRAAHLPGDVADRVLAEGSPGDLSSVEERGLVRTEPGVYRGAPSAGGVLVLAEAPGQWRATGDGAALSRLDVEVGAPLAAYEVPSDVGVLEARPADAVQRLVMVGLEVLVVLAMLSLLLRPPGFAQPAAPSVGRVSTPAQLRDTTLREDRPSATAPPPDEPPEARGAAAVLAELDDDDPGMEPSAAPGQDQRSSLDTPLAPETQPGASPAGDPDADFDADLASDLASDRDLDGDGDVGGDVGGDVDGDLGGDDEADLDAAADADLDGADEPERGGEDDPGSTRDADPDEAGSRDPSAGEGGAGDGSVGSGEERP